MLFALIIFMNISGFSFLEENPEMLTIHDFHTSLAEVEYNTSSKTFEISLRVFTDDFEKALSQKKSIIQLFS